MDESRDLPEQVVRSRTGFAKPEQLGGHSVARYDDAFTLESWGTFQITVYYPALITGEPALPERAAAPCPAIVFSPGYAATKDMYTWFGNHLSTHGYIIVVFSAPKRMSYNPQQRVDGFLRAIDYLLEKNAAKGSPLENMIDTTHIGTAGHSLGAMSNLIVLSQDARIRAGVALSPACRFGTGIISRASNRAVFDRIRMACDRISAPIQIQVGSLDSLAPPANAYLCYKYIAASSKQYVEISRGNHFNYVDEWITTRRGAYALRGMLGRRNGVNIQEQHLIASRYFTAWFNYHLKGDSNYHGYLYGSEAKKDLEQGILSRLEWNG